MRLLLLVHVFLVVISYIIAICVTCPHLRISDPHTLDPYPISSHLRHICASSYLRSWSQIFISDLYIFTFIFRFSYFETASCLHIFGSSSRGDTVLSYHLQHFIMQLFLQLYNLIYLCLQNFISPLSGQPSSSCCCLSNTINRKKTDAMLQNQ